MASFDAITENGAEQEPLLKGHELTTLRTAISSTAVQRTLPQVKEIRLSADGTTEETEARSKAEHDRKLNRPRYRNELENVLKDPPFVVARIRRGQERGLSRFQRWIRGRTSTMMEMGKYKASISVYPVSLQREPTDISVKLTHQELVVRFVSSSSITTCSISSAYRMQ
jgi:16S rRNA G966 N2-methylase RsmD